MLFFFARYSHFVRHCKCSLTDLIRAELICHSLCSASLFLSFSFTNSVSHSVSCGGALPNCQTVVVFSFVFFLHFVFIAILVELPLRVYFIACRSALCADLSSRSPPLPFRSCSSHALCPLPSFVSAFIAGVGLFALLSITLDLSHLTVILRRLL